METLMIVVVLAVFGLCLGSFAGAMVWRLRARQLEEDKSAGEPINPAEFKRLKRLNAKSTSEDRSVCLACGHQLAWYDLIPLASWLSTGGKCRYCHKTIGWLEPLMELGTAALFIVSYLFWPEVLATPLAVIEFALWLVVAVGFVILFAYDLRWFILPNRVVFPLMAVAGCMAIVNILSSSDVIGAIVNVGGALLILSGLYLLIYVFSKGRYIGFGDVKLGVVLALVLADYKLAFIALFAANLIGCLLVIPGMLTGKLKATTHIPFGPLLIVGTLIALFAGQAILEWYLSLI